MDQRFDHVDGTLADRDRQLAEVRGQLDWMEGQLDRIAHSILEEHARRIEALERKVGSRA